MRRFFIITLLAAIFSAGIGAAPTPTGASAAYRKQIEDWRAASRGAAQVAEWLAQPDRPRLAQGRREQDRLGKDNDIVIAKAPAHLGTITLDHGKAMLALNPHAEAKIDGEKERRRGIARRQPRRNRPW